MLWHLWSSFENSTTTVPAIIPSYSRGYSTVIVSNRSLLFPRHLDDSAHRTTDPSRHRAGWAKATNESYGIQNIRHHPSTVAHSSNLTFPLNVVLTGIARHTAMPRAIPGAQHLPSQPATVFESAADKWRRLSPWAHDSWKDYPSDRQHATTWHESWATRWDSTSWSHRY